VPRIRTIKPEFATDEKLARVSRDARLTFVLCITQADDDGLLPGNARQLLAALYPLDETMTDKILTHFLRELVESGRLRWRETRDGSPILQIINWSSHQKIDHKAKSLVLPHLKEVGEELANVSRESREDGASESRSYQGPRTKDQGPSTPAPRKAAGGDEDFQRTFAKYPRRAGSNSRKDALKAWQARLAAGVSPAELESGVERYAAFITATGKEGTEYVKQASSFFGPSEHWAESWDTPAGAKPKTIMIIKDGWYVDVPA